jgi:hypothetical protein
MVKTLIVDWPWRRVMETRGLDLNSRIDFLDFRHGNFLSARAETFPAFVSSRVGREWHIVMPQVA